MGGVSAGAPRRPYPVLGITFLLVALGLGAVAVLLSAVPAPLPPAAGGSTAGPTFFGAVTVLLGWSVVAVVGAWIALHLIQRWRTGASALPGRVYVVLVAIFLVGLALFGLLRFVAHPGPAEPTGPATPGSNGSHNTTPTGGQNNSSVLPGGNAGALGGIPGWVGYVLIVVVVGVGAALLVPVLARLAAPRPAGPAAGTGGARRQLERAIRALSSPDAGAPARERIIAAYSVLLGRLHEGGEELEARTPREIEHGSLARHRIPPETARDLTALFEEARYSAHELGEAEVARIRQALERALTRLPSPPSSP